MRVQDVRTRCLCQFCPNQETRFPHVESSVAEFTGAVSHFTYLNPDRCRHKMDTLSQYSPTEVDDQGIRSVVGPTTPDASAYPVDPQWFGLVKQLKPDNRREHHVRFLYPGRISRVNPHTAVPMTPKSRSRTISPSPSTARLWICCVSFSRFATPAAMHPKSSLRIKNSNPLLMRSRSWPARKNPL